MFALPSLPYAHLSRTVLAGCYEWAWTRPGEWPAHRSEVSPLGYLLLLAPFSHYSVGQCVGPEVENSGGFGAGSGHVHATHSHSGGEGFSWGAGPQYHMGSWTLNQLHSEVG